MADDLLSQIRLNGAVPRHVAVIMDGNGRWARERSLPRPLGHRAGMKAVRSEEHTSELQSPCNLVCRLLLEKKKKKNTRGADLALRAARSVGDHRTDRLLQVD